MNVPALLLRHLLALQYPNPCCDHNIKTVEPLLLLTTHLAQKRKEWVQLDDDASISVGGSQVEQSDMGNAILETGLQESL